MACRGRENSAQSYREVNSIAIVAIEPYRGEQPFEARCGRGKFSLRALAAVFLLRRSNSSSGITAVDPVIRTERSETLGSNDRITELSSH